MKLFQVVIVNRKSWNISDIFIKGKSNSYPNNGRSFVKISSNLQNANKKKGLLKHLIKRREGDLIHLKN